MNQLRHAAINRRTQETDIALSVELDSDGTSEVLTGIGFFDHMLTHIAKHGHLGLTVRAAGDLHIDDHHTVEDVGIALGQALKEAIGDKRGINRYGDALVPMDEALVSCGFDWSGRGLLVSDIVFSVPKIGTFDTDLVNEFFSAVASNAGITLHFEMRRGTNAHHVAECAFKAFGRALKTAKQFDPNSTSIPSTKGTL